jgi:hypothetical protein
MKPEELRALQNDRVFGECLATGVTDGIAWEVRERVERAKWLPGTSSARGGEVVKDRYRVTLALPWSENLRDDLKQWQTEHYTIVAGRAMDALSDGGPEHPSYRLVGSIEARASLESAVESARAWCHTAARNGYVP